MSDDESDRSGGRKKEDGMPSYTMRFTDMPPKLVEKAIKRK